MVNTIISNLTLIAGFWLIGYFLLEKYTKHKKMLLKIGNSTEQNYSNSLKLTALEKFAILLSRLDLGHLAGRTYQNEMTVSEFEGALVLTIFKEFEFNASQQLYISDQLWEILTLTKQEILNFISQSASRFSENESGKKFYDYILNHYTSETKLCQKALSAVKTEARSILS